MTLPILPRFILLGSPFGGGRNPAAPLEWGKFCFPPDSPIGSPLNRPGALDAIAVLIDRHRPNPQLGRGGTIPDRKTWNDVAAACGIAFRFPQLPTRRLIHQS